MSKSFKTKVVSSLLILLCIIFLYLSYSDIFPEVPKIVFFLVTFTMIICLVFTLFREKK